MTGFIASVFTYPNRVPFQVAFEGLELCERKLSCTVLRGLDRSNPVRLLGGLYRPNLLVFNLFYFDTLQSFVT